MLTTLDLDDVCADEFDFDVLLDLEVALTDVAVLEALLARLWALLWLLESADICGFAFVLLFANPLALLSPEPAPPPQAVSKTAETMQIRRLSFSWVTLIIRYYLLHGAALEDMGLG